MTIAPAPVRFLSAGDTALVVEFGDVVDRAISDRVLALADAIESSVMPGVIELVPTFRSLMIHYEPLMLESVSAGCVSLSARHFDDGSIDRRRFEHAVMTARAAIAPIARAYQAHGWSYAVGTSAD